MHFAHLIDSMVNIVEDGIGSEADSGFRLTPHGYSSKLISFFENARSTKPSWSMTLNDQGLQGLGINEGDEGPRLTLREGGNIGIGTHNPVHRLEVKGAAAFETRVGSFARGAVPGDGHWHEIISGLDSLQAFEVVAGIRGRKGSGKYALSHAVAVSTYGGRGSRSRIRATNSGYGSFWNRLRFRWHGEIHNFSLQVKTRRHFGLREDTGLPYSINFHVTRLWSEEDIDSINRHLYM
jgi:hypothetical protein